MIKRVCVFASSCNYLNESYYEEASKLGNLLVQNGFDMVYGGSSLGLMWACAEQVKNNGGKIIGVIPEKLHNLGVHTDECVELIITKGMRDRKAGMDKISDAVVALPGGFGTLEELSEMIVQKQLGYNNKPIVLLNINGFYDKLNEFFEQIIEEKFARQNSRELYYIAQTPKDAVEYLKNYVPKELAISKAQIYER
ncbi:TIGR00730 family Rossman fold protein [bacterium]|nr:TIGR00730 family Rossman fold protein [bacterium]